MNPPWLGLAALMVQRLEPLLLKTKEDAFDCCCAVHIAQKDRFINRTRDLRLAPQNRISPNTLRLKDQKP